MINKEMLKEELEQYAEAIVKYLEDLKPSIKAGDIYIDEIGEMFKNALISELIDA